MVTCLKLTETFYFITHHPLKFVASKKELVLNTIKFDVSSCPRSLRFENEL